MENGVVVRNKRIATAHTTDYLGRYRKKSQHERTRRALEKAEKLRSTETQQVRMALRAMGIGESHSDFEEYVKKAAEQIQTARLEKNIAMHEAISRQLREN